MPANTLNLPCYKVIGIQENEHDYHIDVETIDPPTSCPHWPPTQDLNDVEQRPVFLQQTNVMVEESALSNFANRPQTRAPSGFSRSGRGELNRG